MYAPVRLNRTWRPHSWSHRSFIARPWAELAELYCELAQARPHLLAKIEIIESVIANGADRVLAGNRTIGALNVVSVEAADPRRPNRRDPIRATHGQQRLRRYVAARPQRLHPARELPAPDLAFLVRAELSACLDRLAARPGPEESYVERPFIDRPAADYHVVAEVNAMTVIDTTNTTPAESADQARIAFRAHGLLWCRGGS